MTKPNEVANLSMAVRGNVFEVCARNLHFTSLLDFRKGAKITFEALKTDAQIDHLWDNTEVFAIHGHKPFSATLTRLKRCDPTVALLIVLNRPVVCGELTIHDQLDLDVVN